MTKAPDPVVRGALALALAGSFACGLARADDTGGAGSRKPLRLVFALGPGKEPLEAFAGHLEERYDVTVSWVTAEKSKAVKKEGVRKHAETPFRGIEALQSCDVILSNLYRTWAPPAELSTLQRAFRSVPVVGLRKSHHGFQNWLEADREVFGVSYKGHYFGKDVRQVIAEGKEGHPLLGGLEPFLPRGGLYRHVDVSGDVEPLIRGGPEGREPVLQTWTREVSERGGQRVFYTRYDPEDLREEAVRDMVTRAIFWAARRQAGDFRRSEAPRRMVIDHVVRDIEGWKVRVDRKLLDGATRAEGELALRILGNKLFEILQVVPEKHHSDLRRVPIFLDLEHPLKSMQYHPSAEWLSEHGYDAAMEKAVHIPRARSLVRHQRDNAQPWVVLHELAHAFHDRVLGFDYPPIRRTWEKVREGKAYESVLHISGRKTRHYALTDHKEYFAELTEAYFGTNDFYPFVRAELRDFDRESFELLDGIWGRESRRNRKK